MSTANYWMHEAFGKLRAGYGCPLSIIIPLTEELDKSSYQLLPTVPQGLKPYVFSSMCGTTKVVP